MSVDTAATRQVFSRVNFYDHPRLPVELTDLIIDLVAIQKVKRLRANLAACSLVCRTWTPRSRRHFFRNCRLLLADHNTLAFGTLIRSPLCTIVPFVHQLTMQNRGVAHFDKIADALKLLVKVDSLRLAGPDWSIHGAAPWRGFMTCLPNVLHLDVHSESLGDFDHALAIFCAFPALQRLSIHSLGSPTTQLSSPQDTTRRHSAPPNLSSLTIDAPAAPDLIDWFSRGTTCRLTMLHLRLTAFGDEDMASLQVFLHSQSAVLEHCTLLSITWVNHASVKQLLNFAQFPRLQSLHIGPLFTAIPASPLQRALPVIISSIASPIFKALTLETDAVLFDPRSVAQVDLTSADAFLAEKAEALRSSVASTLSLTILVPTRPRPKYRHTTVDTPAAHTLAVNALQTVFPRLHDLGVLRIEANPLKTAYERFSGPRRIPRAWRVLLDG